MNKSLLKCKKYPSLKKEEKRSAKYTKEDERVMRMYRKKGWTYTAIAEVIGCCVTTVVQACDPVQKEKRMASTSKINNERYLVSSPEEKRKQLDVINKNRRMLYRKSSKMRCHNHYRTYTWLKANN